MRVDNSTGKSKDFYSLGKAMFDSMFHANLNQGNDMTLYQRWLDAKEVEKAAIADRRNLEDQMVQAFYVPKDLDGTKTYEKDGFVVKIVGRLDRKVNADKLQDLAAEYGLTDHLSSLFRWKPEINMSAWKSADALITTPLQDAITTTNGRPSFTITKE